MSTFVSGVVKAAPQILSAVGTGMQVQGQYQSGQDIQAAAGYNASLFEQTAQISADKQSLTNEKFARLYRHLQGSSIATVAGSGYDLSGSFLEVINDSLTQMELDRQIAIYGLEVEQSQAMSSASEARFQGDVAARSGNMSALNTILTQGNDWYQKYGGFGKQDSNKVVYPTDSVKPTVYDPKKGVVSGSYSEIRGWGN